MAKNLNARGAQTQTANGGCLRLHRDSLGALCVVEGVEGIDLVRAIVGDAAQALRVRGADASALVSQLPCGGAEVSAEGLALVERAFGVSLRVVLETFRQDHARAKAA